MSIEAVTERTIYEMSDRELLIRMNERMDSILSLAQDIQTQVGPLIDGITKSPILKMIGVK